MKRRDFLTVMGYLTALPLVPGLTGNVAKANAEHLAEQGFVGLSQTLRNLTPGETFYMRYFSRAAVASECDLPVGGPWTMWHIPLQADEKGEIELRIPVEHEGGTIVSALTLGDGITVHRGPCWEAVNTKTGSTEFKIDGAGKKQSPIGLYPPIKGADK
jgi:hypothetical protein